MFIAVKTNADTSLYNIARVLGEDSDLDLADEFDKLETALDWVQGKVDDGEADADDYTILEIRPVRTKLIA